MVGWGGEGEEEGHRARAGYFNAVSTEKRSCANVAREAEDESILNLRLAINISQLVTFFFKRHL